MEEQKDAQEELHHHEEHEEVEESAEPKYYYGNKMVRIYLQALEDVLGTNGVNALLNLAKLRHLVNN